MAERIDQWPRCHSCLYNWCPAKREDCERCDAVIAILRNIPDTERPGDGDWESGGYAGLPPRLQPAGRTPK